MKNLTPARDTLDPIEIASRDEISALQVERLKWSLRHAYDNVPMYRQRFDEAGVHPDDLQSLGDLARFDAFQAGNLGNGPFREKGVDQAGPLIGVHAILKQFALAFHARIEIELGCCFDGVDALQR